MNFSSASLLTGMTTDVINNVQQVAAGGYIDEKVDFYTQPGYVKQPGVVPEGTIFARFGDANGEILASLNVSAVPEPAPGVAMGLVLTLLIGNMSTRRKRLRNRILSV